MIEKLKRELNRLKDPVRAKVMQRFFKTGVGQYGEGDLFLGLSVPQQRIVAKKYLEITLPEIKQLLGSNIHEYRFTALVILVANYQKASDIERKKIFEFYIANAKRINNWDLVDTSAPYIVGAYLLNKNKSILYKLAKSKNLWEKRIAILSTQNLIRHNQFVDTFEISKILLSDKHDLIHKAVGWMIREVGNRDLAAEEKFLKKYYKKLPRTALRYAIEKFSKTRQKLYLTAKI